MVRYDKAYFEKWYRSDTHRVRAPAELERQVRFVLYTTEHLLNQPVRTVLDVGAGEGAWRTALKRLRPRIRYFGVDPSEYAVARHGRRRNIRLGGAESLDEVSGMPDGFDLVICSSVLNYLPASAFRRALPQIARRTDGIAFLELYTRRDLAKIEGDTQLIGRHAANWYRGMLNDAGFIACGMHLYVTKRLSSRVTELEALGSV